MDRPPWSVEHQARAFRFFAGKEGVSALDFGHPAHSVACKPEGPLLTQEIASQRLTPQEARELTDEVKADAATLWAKLYALHEGRAHIALGYSEWGNYCKVEFGWSPGEGRRLLNAGRVRATLERNVPIGTLPEHAAVARELSPVFHKAPDQLEDVWNEAVATTEHETPTAAEVRAIVDRRTPQVRPRPRRPTVKRLSRHERRLVQVGEYTTRLREIDRGIRGACTRLKSGALIEMSLQNERGDWYEMLRRIRDQANAALELAKTQAAAKHEREKKGQAR